MATNLGQNPPASGGVAAVSAWAQARIQEMQALAECATLTAYRSVILGPKPTGTNSFTADSAVEGGGLAPATGVTTNSVLSNSLFQTPKTGKFAIEYRFKMPAPSVNTCEVGLVNNALSHELSICSLSTTDATKYYIRTFNATEVASSNQTVVNNAGWHNGRLTQDGTTLRMYIDNVLAATLTDFSKITDEPMGAYCVTTGGATPTIVSEFAYGFIMP